MKELRRIGAIIIKDKKILLVKDKNRTIYNLPGVAFEENENAENAIVRGLSEEIGIMPRKMKFFNTFFEESKESNSLMILDTYLVVPDGDLNLNKDKKDLIWAGLKELDSIELNIVLKNQIIPELKKLKALS